MALILWILFTLITLIFVYRIAYMHGTLAADRRHNAELDSLATDLAKTVMSTR